MSPSELSSTIHELAHISGQLLLTEAVAGHSSLTMARDAFDTVEYSQHVEQAAVALSTIDRFLLKFDLDSDQRRAIESARDKLQARLDAEAGLLSEA